MRKKMMFIYINKYKERNVYGAFFLANAKFAKSRFCVERFPIFIGLF